MGLSWIIAGDSRNGSEGIKKGSDNPEGHSGEGALRGQGSEEGVLPAGGTQTATCRGAAGAQHVHTSATEVLLSVTRREGKSQAGVDHSGEQSPRRQQPAHVPEPQQVGKDFPSTISFAMNTTCRFRAENTCF